MTDVKRSAHNPFRTPAVTPDPTGASTSAQVLESSVAQSSNAELQAQLPQIIQPGNNNPDRSRDGAEPRPVDGLAAELAAVNLDETPEPSEPPPAYSPSADMYHGEATVEYGPRRPFQPAPPPPPLPPHLSPHPTGMSQGSFFMNPQYTGFSPPPIHPNTTGNWRSYPGQGGNAQFAPPPRHPTQSQRGRRDGNGSSRSAERPLSDFARDFYASTPDAGSSRRRPSPARSDGSSGPEVTGPEHFERVGPPRGSSPAVSSSSAPPVSRYEPPVGPPPPQSAGPNGIASPSPSRYAPPSGPPPPRNPNSNSNSDASTPTTTPTPGRPLLNKGRVLIYPSGHECRKCMNTGYKNFDPTHPCRKCWERHSKPYGGAIVYAPRSPGFQRPLPSFRPPHIRHQHSQSQPSLFSPPPGPPSPCPSRLRRSASSANPNLSAALNPTGGYPGTPGLPMGSRASQGGLAPPPPRSQLAFTAGPPPPGAAVVRPGDPRIGGRLCWRCGGDGTVSFLIFDVETCPACNGLGRII